MQSKLKKIGRFCFGVILLGAICPAVFAADYYVDAAASTGNLTGDGTSGNPWQTMTFALTQTTTGDVIHAAAGIYKASGMTGSNETFPLTISKYRTLIGAGKYLTTIEASNVDIVQLQIGTSMANLGLKLTTGNYKLAKVMGSGVVIENVYFKGGGWASTRGTGIYFDGTANSAGGRVTSCEVVDCTYGINLYYFTSNSNVTIESSTIRSNYYHGIWIDSWGQSGGGKLVDIHNNLFRNNNANNSYAGIYVNMYNPGSTISIVNNTFSENYVSLYSNSADNSITFKNNIVVNSPRLNRGAKYGTYGIYRSSGSINVSYCDFWNVRSVYNAATGITWGSGNIAVFPRFVDPVNADLRLHSGSACLGAGEGANIGYYDGAGEAGSPYREESYVNNVTGTDQTASGESAASPYQTITFANQYTLNTIHVLESGQKYNAGNGESFPLDLGRDKRLAGAGPAQVTIEGYGNDTWVANTSLNFSIGLYDNSTVEGVTIQGYSGSNAYYGTYIYGGGTKLLNSQLIGGGKAASRGTAVFYDGQFGTNTGGLISGCDINNSSYGINLYYFTSNSNVTIESSTIRSNYYHGIWIDSWGQSGGGKLVDIHNNLFRNNNANNSYAGIYVNMYNPGSTISIVNNTFSENYVSLYSNSADNSITFKNNIVVNSPRLNRGAKYGTYGIYRSSGSINVSYCDFWNVRSVYNAATGITWGSGNIAVFPRFVDPVNADLRLHSGSACLGAGEGANIGYYDGAGEAGSPYREESYVNNVTGTDQTASGESAASPYQTITFANQYTLNTIHVLESGQKYNAGNGESFPLDLGRDKRLAGAGPAQVTIEGYGNDTWVANTSLNFSIGLYDNSTVEGVTIQGYSGSNAYYGTYIYGGGTKLLNSQLIGGGKAASRGTAVFYDGQFGTNTGGLISGCDINN
ncbi:MAG: DUF1565 domain-containing protein, partial [Candidatus Margulisiibacteriota bacterium]